MPPKTRFVELKKLFDILHGPAGCIWDKKQTHLSILPSLREEVEEFIRATRSGNSDHMKEELGDVLLHVLFHARIAEKNGAFDIEDVISSLIAKLKSRHPHVFAEPKENTMIKKIVFLGVLLAGIVWIGGFKYQEMTRTPVALTLINQTIRQLKEGGFNGAVQLYGKGLKGDDVTIEGVTYELRYAVVAPGALPQLRGASSSELLHAAPQREQASAVQVVGYVNCMTIWPFKRFKLGPTFELTFRRE